LLFFCYQVLITGAAGGTGRLVFEKLLNHDFYEGNALVHTKEVSSLQPLAQQQEEKN